MKIDLSGKTAVVTGSTTGIGFAIARGLAGCGATVVVNGRAPAAVERAVAAVKAAAPLAEVRGIAADLGAAAGCDAIVNAEPECDILVNNVGVFIPRDFFDIPDSEWTRFFEVNVMS
jgi:NAD(P)-dependent dehydrogenase (short-subunit alcohol dehydrogenase family)